MEDCCSIGKASMYIYQKEGESLDNLVMSFVYTYVEGTNCNARKWNDGDFQTTKSKKDAQCI